MKIKREFELAPESRIVIRKVRGDLKLQSQEDRMLTIRCREEELDIKQEDQETILTCRSDCRMRVPADAAVTLETVGGDAAISDLSNGTDIGNVGGDLSLRRCGSSMIRGVGGDLLVKDIAGDLNVKTIGGDCWIGRIDGQTRVEAVGGDGSFNRLGGLLRAMLGGDATLNLRAGIHGSMNVDAGGDIVFRLPLKASVSVSLQAGGTIRSQMEEASSVHGRTGQFIVGEGEHKVNLTAGGNLWIGSGPQQVGGVEAEAEHIGADLAGRVERMFAEAEASLGALGEKSVHIDGEGVGNRVRRIVERAIRSSVVGEQLAEVESALDRVHGGPQRERVSDEERLEVLRMVESKKISVEEAEVLLNALGEAR